MSSPSLPSPFTINVPGAMLPRPHRPAGPNSLPAFGRRPLAGRHRPGTTSANSSPTGTANSTGRPASAS